MITKPVFLCGYTSSGKTTVGKELAKLLGVPFFDTDKLLEQQVGQTPQQVFAEKGESYFRDLEHGIALQTADYPPCVISTGGGMLDLRAQWNTALSGRNHCLLQTGHLKPVTAVSCKTQTGRSSKAIPKRSCGNATKKRAVSYRTYADFTVKNDRTPQLTAQPDPGIPENENKPQSRHDIHIWLILGLHFVSDIL